MRSTKQETHECYGGIHLWWERPDSYFRFRSELVHAPDAYGDWPEEAHQLTHFVGDQVFPGRFEAVVRIEYTFQSAADSEDGLRVVDIKEFGNQASYTVS